MLKRTLEAIKRFYNDERGDIVQTAIVIGILAVIAVVALYALQGPLEAAFANIRNQLYGVGGFRGN